MSKGKAFYASQTGTIRLLLEFMERRSANVGVSGLALGVAEGATHPVHSAELNKPDGPHQENLEAARVFAAPLQEASSSEGLRTFPATSSASDNPGHGRLKNRGAKIRQSA